MKKVAAINDLSGIGKCSLTAAIPVLSALGVQTCPVPTAILTSQTGFDGFYIDDCTNKIDEYIKHWNNLNLRFDGIYTGFLANAEQVGKIYNFLNTFKNNDTLLLIDPVMGDNGSIYPTFTHDLCDKLKTLSKEADIITPNLTEACIIADIDYNKFISSYTKDNDPKYLNKVHELGLKIIKNSSRSCTVIITGINYKSAGDEAEYIYNCAITSDNIYFSKSKFSGLGYSGTGDIFASIICGYLVQNRPLESAILKAAEFIEIAAADAYSNKIDRNYGINFEKYLYMLTNNFNTKDLLNEK